jgi:hypothetical protein
MSHSDFLEIVLASPAATCQFASGAIEFFADELRIRMRKLLLQLTERKLHVMQKITLNFEEVLLGYLSSVSFLLIINMVPFHVIHDRIIAKHVIAYFFHDLRIKSYDLVKFVEPLKSKTSTN